MEKEIAQLQSLFGFSRQEAVDYLFETVTLELEIAKTKLEWLETDKLLSYEKMVEEC